LRTTLYPSFSRSRYLKSSRKFTKAVEILCVSEEAVIGHEFRNVEDRTNLIVGLRFRAPCGPVDQPGIQRVRAGRRSPAWQVVLDPECGKALTLLRTAAGSNPARSTTNQGSGARDSSRPPGLHENSRYRFTTGFMTRSRTVSRAIQIAVSKAFQELVSGRFPELFLILIRQLVSRTV